MYWFSDNTITIFGGIGFQSYAWVVDFVGDGYCGVGMGFRTITPSSSITLPPDIICACQP